MLTESKPSLSLIITDLIEPPILGPYQIQFISCEDHSKTTTTVEKDKLRPTLENLLKGNTLICQHQGRRDVGVYAFCNEFGQVKRQEKAGRKAARHFLKLWIDEIAKYSHEGVGRFDVSAMIESHVVSGISSYWSWANSLMKEISGKTLVDLGLTLYRKGDPLEDEYGNRLPSYQYNLQCHICIIESAP